MIQIVQRVLIKIKETVKFVMQGIAYIMEDANLQIQEIVQLIVMIVIALFAQVQ